MIKCKLGDKTYTIDFVNGRALREIKDASETYRKILKMSKSVVNGENVEDEQLDMADAMDKMIRWFCILFRNQFTVDDVLDMYPVDRLMHDIALAILAVQTQTTEVLDEFPTQAAQVTENQAT